MFWQYSSGALLTFVATSTALGTATVVNKCGLPVFYAVVDQHQHAEMIQMPDSYTQQYSQPGNGVSIKLSLGDERNISQFEFTRQDGNINYDISNIDGEPFVSRGLSLVPSMQANSDHPTCNALICSAGESPCWAAYNQPDDVRTFVCSENSDLVMTLCLGGENINPSELSREQVGATPVANESAPDTLSRRSPSVRAWHMHSHTHSRYIRK